MKANKLESLVERFHKHVILNEEEQERTDVIRKVGNSWRILGKKTRYWPAHYKTKTDAENALKAYWANKHECIRRRNKCVKFEGFSSNDGKALLRNVQHFLKTRTEKSANRHTNSSTKNLKIFRM